MASNALTSGVFRFGVLGERDVLVGDGPLGEEVAIRQLAA